jgi:hypothetical protein
VQWSSTASDRILFDVSADLQLRLFGAAKALQPLDLADEEDLRRLPSSIDFDDLADS